MQPSEVPDRCEFYEAIVEEEPASILFNVWFAENAPLSDADTAYVCNLWLKEPEKHGMGSVAEADLMSTIGEQLTNTLAAHGCYWVGRVRGDGNWDLYYYGPSGLKSLIKRELKSALQAAHDRDPQNALAAPPAIGVMGVLSSALLRRTKRGGLVTAKADPKWSVFFDFLMPDAERQRWIHDHHVIERLQANGDSLQTARPIDHFIEFTDASGRDAFVEAAEAKGFTQGAPSDGEASMVQVTKEDVPQIDVIHWVVMELVELASKHNGRYDGWGCPAVTE